MCTERIASRGTGFWIAMPALLLAGFLLFPGVGVQAQTFTVLHQFSGPDGAAPVAGLTMDRAGNLYGTALIGGQGFQYCNLGCGTVFKLTHNSSGWVFTPIYIFTGPDGANPQARVVFGPDGALYGTATQGGANGRGVVFQLRPPATFCKAVQCLWTETILHNFALSNDGSYPGAGDLLFDRAGNIWGTTGDGGDFFSGTVYELVRSNGSWTENVIHSFGAPGDGSSTSGRPHHGQPWQPLRYDPKWWQHAGRHGLSTHAFRSRLDRGCDPQLRQ